MSVSKTVGQGSNPWTPARSRVNGAIVLFEKVNPSHPDKIADRIAGALVDWAYTQQEAPRVAIEILIGHKNCFVITEASLRFPYDIVADTVDRIAQQHIITALNSTTQDVHLAENQVRQIHCGDNGIFKGVPCTDEEKALSHIARDLYMQYGTDGKYILDDTKLIICQSHASSQRLLMQYPGAIINPLGNWTGGLDVDSGATNRKLGSDMGLSVTGGGLHGKDLSKADVSINIYAWLQAQKLGHPVEYCCAIGDDIIDGRPYAEIVNIAHEYIDKVGGFEKFAEWGLI